MCVWIYILPSLIILSLSHSVVVRKVARTSEVIPVLALQPNNLTVVWSSKVSPESLYVIVNTGGPAESYAISPSLPAVDGLSFNASSGLLSGAVNSAASVLTFNVTATNSAGTSAPAKFELTIGKRGGNRYLRGGLD